MTKDKKQHSRVDFSLSAKLTAFTLAEVLITLGIIGVVAALTIPGLINNYKAHRLHTQFLKSYSTVQQVFKQMEADDVSLDPVTYAGNTFYKVFIRYLSGAFDCKASYYAPCFHRLHADIGQFYKDLGNKSYFDATLLDDGQIAMQDGTLLMFENAVRKSTSSSNIYVSVDLNGFNNPPNRAGYDLFTFQFIDEELKPMGAKGTDYTDMEQYCNPGTSNKYNGIACAQKAKDNPDYFKDLIREFK